MKRKLIFIGVVAVVLMLMSSVTAVPQVSSKPLLEQIEKTEENKNNLFEDILSLSESNFTAYAPNKQNLLKLQTKIESFLSTNDLTSSSNYENSDIYKSAEFQSIINKGDGLENEMKALGDELDFIRSLGYDNETLRAILCGIIEDFFKTLFYSEEYTAFVSYFEESTIRPLAEQLGEVYDEDDEDSKLIKSNSIANEGDIEASGSLGYGPEQILIAFCTIIFLACYVTFGVKDFGQAMAMIVHVLLAAIILIPCIIILVSDVVFGVAGAVFEAFLITIFILGSIAVDTLLWTTENFGHIFGFCVWFLAFMINLPLLPIEFFVIFLVMLFQITDWEVGYVIINLGPLVSAILESAVENARDIFDDYLPLYLKSKNTNRTISFVINQFFERLIQKIGLLEKMFSQHLIKTI